MDRKKYMREYYKKDPDLFNIASKKCNERKVLIKNAKRFREYIELFALYLKETKEKNSDETFQQWDLKRRKSISGKRRYRKLKERKEKPDEPDKNINIL